MTVVSGKHFLVVGLGATGASAVRFLRARGATVRAIDSRAAPPQAAAVREVFPEVEIRTGGLALDALDGVDEVLVSPGVDLQEPLIAAARERGLPLAGDIEWFARCATAPVVAITGSNGKSTVTALVAAMAREAGRAVAAGGNFGPPALDLLESGADLYVLELSSFQLELTESLAPAAAVALNVSADHIDRHGSLANYVAIKSRIYRQAVLAVVNGDDPQVAAMATGDASRVIFGADAGDWYLEERDSGGALCRDGEPVLATAELLLRGRHNHLNALAALALGEAVGLSRQAMVVALRGFAGLPHRCQFVAHIGGVDWVNDSKGTNVGAVIASLEGLSGPIVLLAGGQAKGADFAPVGSLLARKGRAAVLFGTDAEIIAVALRPHVPVQHVPGLAAAVRTAARTAERGDTVLLSPGCASFDQFRNYEDRGDQFVAAVRELDACWPA